MNTLNDLAARCHATAVEKGWYEQERSIPELLMLCVSELSEALEEAREGRMAIEWIDDKPVGFPIELADAIIRILDMAAHLGIDIDEAVRVKMAYNATRPHRHGNKRY